jgi:sulfite reductase alpha subunit-like flavoprotein
MAKSGTVPDRTALVLYGTETGTAQDIAEEATRILERLYFITDVTSFDNVSTVCLEVSILPISLAYIAQTDLSSYTICLFVISTTGQGDFPSGARHFWTRLLKKKLRVDFLRGLHYALIGLGDSSYVKLV